MTITEAFSGAAAPAIDRRVLALLDAYAALAGAVLTPLAPELYQLEVPRGEEARFGGRSGVRVAFTVDALELDDRAEMAIVGSAFVGQLIEAIRQRGARLLAGRIVPNAGVESEPALPVPIRNGTATAAQSSLARHVVGRLTARVAIRAGTELRERLAESAVYDLCSGIAMPSDVAAACSGALPLDAADDRWRSIELAPTQKIGALVEKMLGGLEVELGSEIDEISRSAQAALSEELARIDRYYTAMLDDIGGRGSAIPDADSRTAIQAEHRRRADEERDRHAVRAVVHPIQLTNWELLAQRATWALRTPSGREASFTAQRSLAGEGRWAFGCPTCGAASPTGLHVCTHEHAACDSCASACSVCREHYCREHGIAACHVDNRPACDEHARRCAVCRRTHCSVHEGTCFDGAHAVCSSCLGPCAICGRKVCDSHAAVSQSDSPRGARRFCRACALNCEGGTGEVVGPDEVTDCASCERVVCERHQSRCAVDGKVHCSKHLRRTDRSRRLVCEHDRATCTHEPHSVFATDEVLPCASCGRIGCDHHLGTCVVDRNRHCLDHLAPVGDKAGAVACAAHRSTCHVDGRQYSIEGTSPCPACGRLACRAHTRECSNCRRAVCSSDFVGAHSKVCATCSNALPGVDLSDDLIAAMTEARGGEAPSPKSWKVGRDARHIVVDLDLGWTRRLVLAVPHGQDRAERVVAHSVFASRVVR